MPQIQQQKIVVLLTLSPKDKNVILNGIKLAGIFKKELCLLLHRSKKELRTSKQAKTRLADSVALLREQVPGMRISGLILSEKALHIPEKLSDSYEAVLILSGRSGVGTYFRAIVESPIPFLVVDETRDHIPDYKTLVLPVDWRSENSDSTLWSANFGRYSQASIIVLAANDRAKTEQKKVARNVAAARRLYRKFSIPHRIFRGNKSSFKNAFEALQLAKDTGCDLMIVLCSSHTTPLDWLLGLSEKKIVKQAGDLPLLLVNPRKDNYILCD